MRIIDTGCWQSKKSKMPWHMLLHKLWTHSKVGKWYFYLAITIHIQSIVGLHRVTTIPRSPPHSQFSIMLLATGPSWSLMIVKSKNQSPKHSENKATIKYVIRAQNFVSLRWTLPCACRRISGCSTIHNWCTINWFGLRSRWILPNAKDIG